MPPPSKGYDEWNQMVAGHFFNPAMEGREVIMLCDKETLEGVAREHDTSFEHFVFVVKEGPEFLRGSSHLDVFEMAHRSYNHWRDRNLPGTFPPYVAYLALFIYAATVDGDYNPNAYYPKLANIVGDAEPSSMCRRFSKIDALWKDLERWSQDDMGEGLGRFSARQHGGYVHVGWVYSQTLISVSERKRLPRFFLKAKLDPNDPPSEQSLLSYILNNQQFFNPRTIRLIEPGQSQELAMAVVGLVRSELADWDGGIPHDLVGESTPSWNAYARVCLGEELGVARSHLRLRVNLDLRDFPEEPLEMRALGPDEKTASEEIFTCSLANQYGWSTPLRRIGSSSRGVFEAAALDWRKGLSFVEVTGEMQAEFKSASVRNVPARKPKRAV